MQPPQQAAQQAVQSADSLAAQQADTTDVVGEAVERLSRDAASSVRALQRGDLEAFQDIFFTSLAESVADFVPTLFAALVIFAILYVGYRLLNSLLSGMLTRSRRVDVGLQSLLMKTYRVAALSFIVVIFLGELGFNVTALLAGLSIAGIAVGFAARDTLENFISGVTILTDRPFRIGDKIELEEVYGTVEEITLRSTRIRTLNNVIMVLPNKDLITKKLLNHSMQGVVRVEVPFGIAYKEFPEEARRVVLQLTEDDERLHPDYPPSVVTTALNDSSVDMALRLYIGSPDLEVPLRYEYVEKVREALREADIEIPFPHRQLFLDEAKALDGTFLSRPRLTVTRSEKGDEQENGEALESQAASEKQP